MQPWLQKPHAKSRAVKHQAARWLRHAAPSRVASSSGEASVVMIQLPAAEHDPNWYKTMPTKLKRSLYLSHECLLGILGWTQSQGLGKRRAQDKEKVGWTERVAWKRVWYCMYATSGNFLWDSEASNLALWQPRGVGWEGMWEGVQDGRDMDIPVADSCWCMAETNTIS